MSLVENHEPPFSISRRGDKVDIASIPGDSIHSDEKAVPFVPEKP